MFRAPTVPGTTALRWAAVAGLVLAMPTAGAAAVQAPNFGLQFDGFDDLVDLDPAAIGTPVSVTVEAWVRIDATGKHHMLVTMASSDFNDGFTLFVNSADRPAFTVATDVSTKASVSAPTPIEPGEWYHLAGTYDAEAERVRILVDGIEQGSAAYDQPIRYASGRGLLLGAQHKSPLRPGRFLRGALDEVRIWAIARTETDLIDELDVELTGEEPGLAGYWPMNEGTGEVTADASGSANTGELIGGPIWIDTPWRAVTELLVTIDVKPGTVANRIPVQSRGKLPVAILATSGFDPVESVDPATLTFGQSGDEPSLHLRGRATPNCAGEDVNADGQPDLVCHFDMVKTGLQAGDNRAALRGATRTGDAFRGEDWINAFQAGPILD